MLHFYFPPPSTGLGTQGTFTKEELMSEVSQTHGSHTPGQAEGLLLNALTTQVLPLRFVPNYRARTSSGGLRVVGS